MQQFFQFISNHLILWTLLIVVLIVIIIEELRNRLSSAPSITAQELAMLTNREKDKVVVVDIRSQEAFRKEHILSSINIASSEKQEEFSKRLQQKQQNHIILVDQAGTTSPALAKYLLANKFVKVSLLKGGITAWKQAGMPLANK